MTALTVRRYGTEDLPKIRQAILDIHADAYAEVKDDPFVQKFPWFVDHWGGNPGFACVIAYEEDDEPVGFAYGAPANEGREWWREHLVQPPERHKTFSYSELAVRPGWRKLGLGERLSRALLEERTEDLAVLLVDPEHPKVQTLYESWGFRKVGDRRPFPDSPTYVVMLAELPLT